jgi:DNA-binding XRE family transcriptional regulator
MPVMKKSDAPSLRRDVSVRLRVAVYDKLAAKNGVTSVVAAAKLHGIYRTSMFDYRSGRKAPHLALAMKMAADLGTTVEKIFELQPVGDRRG